MRAASLMRVLLGGTAAVALAIAWMRGGQPASAEFHAEDPGPPSAAFNNVTFSNEPFLTGAAFPTALAFAPDGRLFYNERCGGVRVVMPDGTLLATPFATPPAPACTGDYALIGLALDPDFETNHYVYISYMRTVSTEPLVAQGAVMRYTEAGNVGTDPIDLYTGPPTDPVLNPNAYHGINQIHFGPDGKLYISTGENNNRPASQDVASPLGKILRVNPDGSAPADNPYFGTPGADQRVFASGLRNSYDFAFHPANGALFATENGFNTCDELNIITAGANYEWPDPFDPVTLEPLGPTCTSGAGTPAAYYFRFFEWQQGWDSNSTSAPTGVVAIDGDQYPALGDSLLTCEFRSSVLRLLQLGGPDLDEVVSEPRIIEGTESCRLAIAMAPNGDIFYSNMNSIRRLIIDSDSDTVEDKLDNCPIWPNTEQTPPAWPVPAGDSDCDGFQDSREQYFTTSVTTHCAADNTENNEASPDGWPVDFNDDGSVSVLDVALFQPVYGATAASPNWDPRFDLSPAGLGRITMADVLVLSRFFGMTCLPAGG